MIDEELINILLTEHELYLGNTTHDLTEMVVEKSWDSEPSVWDKL